jgi:REP element-mobilizing transposase RayT
VGQIAGIFSFMVNTYTQIHIHAIFAVQNRVSLIQKNWRDALYKYIAGIVQKNGHRLLAIGGMPDHIHVLFGMRPVQGLSELMQDLKGSSSKWINENHITAGSGRFSWQEGFGAFSYSQSQVATVVKYIVNQEQHHRVKTFLEEYEEFLKLFRIEHDQRYAFKPID